MHVDLYFQQLFEHESSTYTYLLADKKTGEAIIIDPVIETAERDFKLMQDLGFKLKYILDTHVHADHITGAKSLRDHTGAKTVLSANSGVECVDHLLEDEESISFGQFKITGLMTPGHTNGCMSFVCENMAFTGDALLISGTGRTDFQQGSSEKLYESITKKLFTLSDETILYPGHDYRGMSSSTIGIEKKLNPRIGNNKSKAEFVKIMSELKLAHPKKIHEAVPANLLCGEVKKNRIVQPQIVDGIPEVTTAQTDEVKKLVELIDVRTPEEYLGEYGHIPGAKLITLGGQLDLYLKECDKEKEIIFVCRSGARSGVATKQSIDLGFKKTANMVGGMIAWTQQNRVSESKN